MRKLGRSGITFFPPEIWSGLISFQEFYFLGVHVGGPMRSAHLQNFCKQFKFSNEAYQICVNDFLLITMKCKYLQMRGHHLGIYDCSATQFDQLMKTDTA